MLKHNKIGDKMEKNDFEQVFNLTKNGIAEKIKALRTANAITQEGLEDRSGVTTRSISDIENGVVDIKLSTLIKLPMVLTLILRNYLRRIRKPKSVKRNMGRCISLSSLLFIPFFHQQKIVSVHHQLLTVI